MSNLIEAKSGHEGSQVSGPLVGLRVLDISKGITGALATMIMADYGAEVIKVDPPAGDPLARGPAFRVWNRGKKSIVIDLSQDSGQQTLRQLSRHVDVILETFRPGEAESYDLDYPQLSQVNPGLIYCSISAYGQRGPWKNRHGYEGLVAAASGIMTEQPGVRDGPMFSSIPLATLGACMLALQGILAALHTRNASGKGQKVSTSLYQGALAIRYPILVFSEKISTLQVNNTSPLGGLPSYRMYPCADGKWIHIGCLTRAFWDKLAVATDCLELATEARFDAAPSSWPNEADRLVAIELIGERLKRRPRSHWLEVLEEGDVPSAPVMTTQEYMDHPQVRHNRMVVSVKDPVLGDMDQMGLVIGFSETPGVVRASAPLLGQHTQEVKSWLSKNPNGPKPLDAESQITGRPRYPLEGMRVLDLSSFIAGPLGAMVLSDLGADVIKVEPIEGEGARAIPFLILGGNRGKRSIALDLKAPISRDIIHRLIKRCDVVVHNMRVGVAERLGIDYGSVRKIQPDVIYVHSTAYGSTGPEARSLALTLCSSRCQE